MSRIHGSIRPTGDAAAFTREAWCRIVKRRPEFRHHPPLQFRSPFNLKIVETPIVEDAAEVLNGSPVGRVWWSCSEEPLVNVEIERLAMSLVSEWAAEMGGEFHEEPWE